MPDSAQSLREVESGGRGDAADPFAEARRKLFPPLRNRTLAQAAGALANNRTDIAQPLLSKFLQKHPRDPDALNLMADIARRSRRFDDAERLMASCVEQCPDGARFRFNYAVILRLGGKTEQALEELDALLAEDPEDPVYRDQKAKTLRAMGRLDDALALRRELTVAFAASSELWLLYGDTSRLAGNSDQCIAAYRRALELAPSSSAAWLRLSELQTYRFAAADIERMEAQLAVSGRISEDRANLHFALGKAYSDQKLHAKSFENYAKANALPRLAMNANPYRLGTHRSNCQTFLTEAFFADRRGWGCRSRAPIFIVGMPRSGTTLLEQILSSHADVEGLGELPDLDTVVIGKLSAVGDGEQDTPDVGDLFDSKSGLLRAYPLVFGRLDANDFQSMGEEYLKLTARRRKLERPFFTDKALSNFGHAGLIHLMLPGAKIIDARRHPLDCGWSCFKNHFVHAMPFAYRLSDIGHHYANYVGLMAHFDRVLPGRIHRVVYENLIADPEAEVRRLLAYLELPFQEQCLRFHENRRVASTLSSEQVRLPLYKSGVAQWRPYEPWLGPLKSSLGPVLDSYPRAPSDAGT
jgi:tetratricopeptide (TPR) repeat protein